MNKPIKILLTTSLVFTSTWAMAHSGHEAMTYGSFATGFSHPIMGMDHLLAMVAIGFWSIRQNNIMKDYTPLFVIVGMVFGALMAWEGIGLSGVELGIALSVLLMGALIATLAKLPAAVGGGLITLFMVAHGYAHGAEMSHGASTFAYMTGFVIATLLITYVGRAIGIATLRFDKRLAQLLGGLVAIMGGIMVFG